MPRALTTTPNALSTTTSYTGGWGGEVVRKGWGERWYARGGGRGGMQRGVGGEVVRKGGGGWEGEVVRTLGE